MISIDKSTLKTTGNRVELSYDLPDGLEVGTKFETGQFWLRNYGSINSDSQEFILYHHLIKFDKTKVSKATSLLSGSFSGAFYDDGSSTWSTLSLGSYLNLYRDSDPKKEATIVFDSRNLLPKGQSYGTILKSEEFSEQGIKKGS